jgi:hypothetical protein
MNSGKGLMPPDRWFASMEQAIFHGQGDIPPCIASRIYQCSDCIFGDIGSCPVVLDPDSLAYLRWLYERAGVSRQIRAKRIEILRDILRRHRLPLHWEVIAKVALEEAPALFESVNSVRNTLFLNQSIFSHQGEGVFGLHTADLNDISEGL